MTFHCVTHADLRNTTARLLQEACTQEHIEFQVHDPKEFSFTSPPQVAPHDLFYRDLTIGFDRWAALRAEQVLINDDTATFYDDPYRVYSISTGKFLQRTKAGIPSPKTVPHVTRDRNRLEEYAEYLGGFPVVLKIVGGSHGRGVMRIDSLESLVSVVDHLLSSHDRILLQEYIQTTTSLRLIVLGDAAIGGISYAVPTGDFRSNAAKTPRVQPLDIPPEIASIAVRAVHMLRVEFGGVDIIQDAEGNSYVIEVNLPCNFARVQNATGIDVAGQMVQHLVQKARS